MNILRNRKVLGTILGTILFISCLMYFTYAYYVWRSEENTIFSINISDFSGVDFGESDQGKNVCYVGPSVDVENIGPVLSFEDGVKVEFNVNNATSSAKNINVVLKISSISDSLLNKAFKYKLFKDVDSGSGVVYDYKSTPVVEGNFENFSVGDSGNIIADNISVGAKGNYNFIFIVYIDGNERNENDMQDSELKSILSVGNCDEGLYLGPNSPDLDNNNLIPVYYDAEAVDTSNGSVGAWKKADMYNNNNSWYNYGKKMWANAILIKDSSKRLDYNISDVGTLIPIDDIDAFFVWIPRFKYRVWNINRQLGLESDYAYEAYTNGIEISFEKSNFTTGNVRCVYDASAIVSGSVLADRCVYNNTDVITTSSDNNDYDDAWYTHPAFTFGGVEKSGFWIGKFETGGTGNSPLIKPDIVSLSYDISTQYITSKKFQNYGLSSSMDAHMLTNLEWGALSYLTYSVYGLCDNNGCRDVYYNNSKDSYYNYYTGRSSGLFASESDYSASGTYDYRGYLLNDTAENVSDTAISKVASTTGNITGVYDTVGGYAEYVMANSVDQNGKLNYVMFGENWNTINLQLKYYNSYSYISSDNSFATNSSRLGDATAEVNLGYIDDMGDLSEPNLWGFLGEYNSSFGFVNEYDPWFVRGGGDQIGSEFSSIFYYVGLDGGTDFENGFRVSIS